jgi:hypothetical protein
VFRIFIRSQTDVILNINFLKSQILDYRGSTSYGQSRAGRSPENDEDEILESANSNYFGSTKLRDGTVKIHHHGQDDESSGRTAKSDEAIQIAWNPVVKKLTGVGDKKFKRKILNIN